MLLAIILGAGFGAGVLLLATGLRPARPDLSPALARLYAPLAPAPAVMPGDAADPSVVRRLKPVARHLAAFNLPSAKARRDLDLIERSPGSLLAEKLAAAIGVGMLPALGSVAAGTVLGIHLGVLTTAGAALIAGAGGFLAPDYQAKEKAAALRAQMRHDLSAYLDLTVITLAGGAGTEGALAHAASSGAGVTFARIRSALTRGAHQGRPVSESFAELGEQTGVAEFTELGSNLALAGHEGARIRAVLSAKAATMRKQALAGEQAKAGAATEHLSLPMILLVLGFLVYIGFPAVSAVATSFTR